MKKVLVFVFTAILLLSACPNPPPQPAPIDGNGDCAAAETHLKELGCIPQGAYTAKGKSFEEFCQDVIGAGVDLNPGCLSNITSCKQMNDCVQGK